MKPALMARMGLAVALVGVMASALPSQAVNYTGRYEVAGAVVTLTGINDPAGVTSDGTIDIGGVSMAAPTGGWASTVSVWAVDDVDPLGTGLVSISVCQDVNQDTSCSSADGDVTGAGCTSPSQKLNFAGVKKNLPITVFVRATWGCPTFLIPDWVTGTQASATTGRVIISS